MCIILNFWPKNCTDAFRRMESYHFLNKRMIYLRIILVHYLALRNVSTQTTLETIYHVSSIHYKRVHRKVYTREERKKLNSYILSWYSVKKLRLVNIRKKILKLNLIFRYHTTGKNSIKLKVFNFLKIQENKNQV